MICDAVKSSGCTHAWNSGHSTRIHSSVTTGMMSCRPTTSLPCRRRSFTPSSTSGMPVQYINNRRSHEVASRQAGRHERAGSLTDRLTAEEADKEYAYARYLLEHGALGVLLHVQLVHRCYLDLNIQIQAIITTYLFHLLLNNVHLFS